MKTIERIGISLFVAGLLLVGLMAMGGPGNVAASNPHAPAACVPGPHSGHITADETWCLADSPHEVNANLTVDPGVVLTVEAGVSVTVKPEEHSTTAIYIQGDLQALGTPSQPITFTSIEDDGDPQWSGIHFDGGTGHLQHVTVRYTSRGIGAEAPVNIKVSDTASGQVLIEDSVLEKNGGGWGEEYGLHVSNGVVTMRDTTIREIGGGGGQDAAVYIEGGDSQVTLSGNHLVDNVRNVVALAPGAMMNHDATLTKQAEMDAYVLQTTYGQPDYIVPQGVTLTIEPGVMVKGHDWNTNLWVQGNLQALGTPSQPITFTSEADSDPEQWSGIYFDGGTGDLQHVVVRYAGSEDPRSDIAVVNTAAGQVHVKDSELRDVGDWGEQYGLYVENGHVQMENTLITHIGAANGNNVPIYIKGGDSDVTLLDNRMADNPRNVIKLGPHAMMHHDATLTPQIGQEAFFFPDDFTVPPTVTLTIDPGAVLETNADKALWVQGNLQALGTVNQPILFTSNHDDPAGAWSGLRFSGGVGHLRFAEVRYANTNRLDGQVNGDIVVNNTPADQEVLIQQSYIEHAAKWNNQFGLYVEHGRVRVENTLFRDAGAFGAGHPSTAALRVGDGGEAHLTHDTFTENPNCSVVVDAGGMAVFTNTIIANSYVGVRVEAGGQVQMTNTLWDNNDTHILGTVNETGHIEGQAAFDLDGYHLTEFSAALGQGVDAGLTKDIDGEARPQPAGSAPDLGADETGGAPATGTTAEKVAFDPQWVFEDNNVGLPKSHLRQRYLIRLFNDEGGAQHYNVFDTLPEGFHLTSESHNLPMQFTNAEPALTWQSLEPLAPRGVADIFIDTASRALGDYTNQADVHIGTKSFHVEATETAPLVPPIISFPYSFRHCTAEELGGAITVKGASQSNAIVRIYENGEEVLSTTADADGYFEVAYPSTRIGYDDHVILTVRTCKPDNPTECSDPSSPVDLMASDGNWCVQASTWSVPTGHYQGEYHFGAAYHGDEPVVIGPRHFNESTITLYVPLGHQHVEIIVDGYLVLQPVPPVEPPTYTFQIPPSPKSVCIVVDGQWVDCPPLIDPDGYVFDVTQGFDPENPTLHAVEGVTVTCMVNIPEWGGWVPWPAELYDNQQNPQVTGPDGYFSFFTPPGDYYLKVDAIDGYQSWRSPVIHVISDVVHANVPYTPLPARALNAQAVSGVGHEVLLTDDGPQPGNISINKGDWIEWEVPQDPDMTAKERMALEDAPRIRLLSDLDPVQSTDGWDGGMMTPDQRYLRGFAAGGDYTYSDGNGHTGTIHVTGSPTVWRFRGYTCRGPVAYPFDYDHPCANGEPLADVSLHLYGRNEGDTTPVFEKTVTSNVGGFFNFYMIQPWIYDVFTLEVEPPEGLVPADAWSADGTVLDAGTIQWLNAGPGVHRNTFYLDEPTPTPTPTPSPTPTPTSTPTPLPTLTPTPTPTSSPTPSPTPPTIYLPVVNAS